MGARVMHAWVHCYACMGAHVHACVGACVHACVDACRSLRTTLDLSSGATYFLVLVVVLFLFFEARVSPRPRTHQVGQADWPATLGPCHRSPLPQC